MRREEGGRKSRSKPNGSNAAGAGRHSSQSVVFRDILRKLFPHRSNTGKLTFHLCTQVATIVPDMLQVAIATRKLVTMMTLRRTAISIVTCYFPTLPTCSGGQNIPRAAAPKLSDPIVHARRATERFGLNSNCMKFSSMLCDLMLEIDYLFQQHWAMSAATRGCNDGLRQNLLSLSCDNLKSSTCL